MTNRKNYNSILFLTVYFGLVLVGGSSQVLAHAATNSLFDLRNEIEFKDDLDNNPDDSCAELKAKTDEKDNQFIEEYFKLVSESLKKYPSVVSFEILGGIENKDFPSLRKDFSISFFQLKSNKDSLFSKISLNVNAFLEFEKFLSSFSSFSRSIDFQKCNIQNSVEKVIAKNTKLLSVNNQVFIVTRLPRASIDSLLN
jgi:hypothetical protein